ncbi:sugar-binding transcriptional regulator [Corynebacterium sp. YSMAA1_1_D6]|nr:sugar-binding transcriptional regulator [Corynebacterium sp.]
MEQRDQQSLQVAKLYYRGGMSQGEVASEMGLSRPTVAKLLQHAKARGYVTVEIHDPREDSDELGQRLMERYGIEDVRLVYSPRGDEDTLTEGLGRVGAKMLHELVHDGMSIGISWGNTMHSVARHLQPKSVAGVEVVQLKGGHSHSSRVTNDMDTLKRVSSAFGAEAISLPLPVIFDSAVAKEIVEKDRHISSILNAGRQADLAVFTVGDVSRSSLLLNLGYLSEQEIQALEHHAVGDACSRFYTAEGTVAEPAVDARTVGISLSELREVPQRLMVAGGLQKSRAIDTALRMNLPTHVVIDKETANHLLQQ